MFLDDRSRVGLLPNKGPRLLRVSQVTVFSDHASLQWFLKMKEEKQGRVARWVIELQNHHHC
jgi:hypothetical protein